MASNALENEDVVDSDGFSVSSIRPIVSDIQLTDEGAQLEKPLEQPPEEEYVKDPTILRYHTACQNGDLKVVKEMIESGLVNVKHDWDERERISGLHWASVNNRLNLVKYLIYQGADVNMKGGDLEATPLHWASKSGYVYIVHCLLANNADPNIKDKQGFNLLHTSTFSSNIMLVLYVLFSEKVHVDSTDPTGKTALHWAAYQGDLLSVQALLRFRANIRMVDSNGFTALHWATVRGQANIMKELIDHGSDVFVRNNDGKNCFMISKEMKTENSLQTALFECGLNNDGLPLRKHFSNPLHAKAITFLTPGIVLGILASVFPHINPLFLIFLVVFLFLIRYLLFNFVLPSYILKKKNDVLLRTPFLAGVLGGTIFWIFYVWLFKYLPFTFTDAPLRNLLFFCLLIGVSYSFKKLIQSDPGCIPSETNLEVVRNIVAELLQIGKFDANNFCIRSWVRIPLRARYKKSSNALIARYDHYCPWVYNCIGFKNHKLFLYFIMMLIVGIPIFFSLTMEYFDELDYLDKFGKKAECALLGNGDLCRGYTYDPFAFLIMLWTLPQFIWVSFLSIIQFIESLKGATDHEFHIWTRKRHGLTIFEESFNSTPAELASADKPSEPIAAYTRDSTPRQRNCCNAALSVLGYDRLLSVVRSVFGKETRGQYSQPLSSPFPIDTDYGWKQNLQDFWLTSDFSAPFWRRLLLPPEGTKGLLNGEEVDYFKLYKLPDHILSIEEIA